MTTSEVQRPLRLSLPSKGRLAEEALTFLSECGLKVSKPNPRQYEARIPGLPELVVLFQRPADIVVSVRDGSVDFGISGMDLIAERRGENGDVLVLHDRLNFGQCSLALAVPESWEDALFVEDLRKRAPLRVATKYPSLTATFLDERNIPHTLITAEGTLEAAPAIGYADVICDLVSSGQTLRDNRLRALVDGVVLFSEAALIANTRVLKMRPDALRVARHLLEYVEARLRASDNLAVFANIRGASAEEIGKKLFEKTRVGGLQGPTISPVVGRQAGEKWFAVNIIVRRSELFQAVNELRSVGGSGVVVMPIDYIFEEEPPRYTAMLHALQGADIDEMQRSAYVETI